MYFCVTLHNFTDIWVSELITLSVNTKVVGSDVSRLKYLNAQLPLARNIVYIHNSAMWD